MTLDSSIGQIEATTHCNPLERFARKILFDVFWVCTESFIWRVGLFLFGAVFGVLIRARGDDDIVLGLEFVDGCGIFLINEVLFF